MKMPCLFSLHPAPAGGRQMCDGEGATHPERAWDMVWSRGKCTWCIVPAASRAAPANHQPAEQLAEQRALTFYSSILSSLGSHRLGLIAWVSSLGSHRLGLIAWVSSLGSHRLGISKYISWPGA